ncbi:hypothetical protein CISIN_1g0423582mg, partial [Citrus sinensis]
FCTSVPGIMES